MHFPPVQGTGRCEFQVHQLLLLLSRISLSAMWWDSLYNYTCLLYRLSHHIQLCEIQFNGSSRWWTWNSQRPVPCASEILCFQQILVALVLHNKDQLCTLMGVVLTNIWKARTPIEHETAYMLKRFKYPWNDEDKSHWWILPYKVNMVWVTNSRSTSRAAPSQLKINVKMC